MRIAAKAWAGTKKAQPRAATIPTRLPGEIQSGLRRAPPPSGHRKKRRRNTYLVKQEAVPASNRAWSRRRNERPIAENVIDAGEKVGIKREAIKGEVIGQLPPAIRRAQSW